MSEEIVSELRTVTLTQAVQLTLLNPDVIYMWRGEPGVGKSSAAQELARQTGYPLAMIDVPNLDLGDVARSSLSSCVVRARALRRQI